MKQHRKPSRPASLSEQLHRLLLSILIPVCLITVLMLCFFISTNVQYSGVSETIAEVSGFNQNFKEDVDLKMYYYVIDSTYSEGLPLEEVGTAYNLAQALLESTENKESIKAIRSVLSLCENLESRLYQIAETEGYDARVAQLESNVYVLTDLIQQYMYNYLYHEAGQLAQMQDVLNRQLWLELSAILLGALLLVLLLWKRVVRISHSITRPIDALSQRVASISQGDLTVQEPVAAEDEKLKTLSEGFEQMVYRLNCQIEQTKTEQERLRTMEFALLQAQINPHFLYNTLDTIIWLVEMQKNDQAVEMVTSLSNFFRSSLSKGRDVITLAEEAVHVQSYLEIQQVRYQDILNYSIQMDKDLADCVLPKLTLQPLVENALYHGIKAKRGLGTICVRSWRDGNAVRLEVSDTGAGMSQARLQQVRQALQTEHPVGFGMATVQKRLQLLYGDRCRFDVESKQAVGTTVFLSIPIQREQEAQT